MACKVTGLIPETCSLHHDTWHSSRLASSALPDSHAHIPVVLSTAQIFFAFPDLKGETVEETCVKAFPKAVWRCGAPLAKERDPSHQGDASSSFSGMWLCLQHEQPRGAFRNARLANILLTFADSLLHCLFPPASLDVLIFISVTRAVPQTLYNQRVCVWLPGLWEVSTFGYKH